MPSKLDLHVARIEGWFAAEPQLSAIAIVSRLADLHPDQFGKAAFGRAAPAASLAQERRAEIDC
jgi:hypothetical protein